MLEANCSFCLRISFSLPPPLLFKRGSNNFLFIMFFANTFFSLANKNPGNRQIRTICSRLNSSLDDIQLICKNSRPGIIGLCETFLNEKIQLLMDIPGYNSIFLNRKIAKKKGGG